MLWLSLAVCILVYCTCIFCYYLLITLYGVLFLKMFDFNATTPQSDFIVSDAKYTAAVAGFGSGKTESALVRILSNMLQAPGIDQAYLAPTYPLIRDIWYPKVEKFLDDLKIPYGINKSNHVITIPGLGKVYCRTMDNPSLIIGWEACDAVLDEFDVLPIDKALEVFRKVSGRLRQKHPHGRVNQIYVTTTPEGFRATYKLFKKDPLPKSKLVQMSTYSNAKNLPEDYIQDLFDQYPAPLREAYLMGEFVNLTEGSVYYAYDRDINDTKYVYKPREPLHIGMDFNVYNMAAIVHIIRDGIPYAVDELIGLRDTPDTIEAIQEKYVDHHITVYPDSSGDSKSSKGATLSDISLLEEAGFEILAPKANPLIKNRVQAVNKKFENETYHVNKDRCPIYADCLEQQTYSKITGQPDKTSGLDHPTDAGGYFISYRWPIKRKPITELEVLFN